MNDWDIYSFAALTENLDSRRKPVKEADRKRGPFPYYGASGVVDYVDDYLFDGLHLLIAEDGENLRTRKLPIAFLADGKFWVNNHAHIVRGNDKADTRFLHYALQVADVTSYLSGSTMPKLTQANLNRIPIRVPDITTQRAIADVLAALDDKIELNRRMNETLEQIAQAIFKDWFIDFGPVRRKQEGASDPKAIMGGLVQDAARAMELAALFPDAFGEEGLPEGWANHAIGSLVETVGGSTPSTSDSSLWEPGEHFWATPKDLSTQSDPVLFATDRRISATGLARISSGLLPAGTVLLSSRAPIGYLAIAQVPVAVNQGFIALKPNSTLGSSFLYFWCKANMEKIIANANGSTFQEISKKNFRPIASPLPTDVSLLREAENTIAPLFARLTAASLESRTLAETRDYLLPRLMSGEVRVRDAAKFL